MARKAVMDAFKAHLAANWTTLPLYETNAAGEAADDGSGFIVIQYPVAVEEPASTGSPGSNLFREEGGLRFVIVTPRGAGIDTPATYADELAAIFRGIELLSGNLRTWGASSSTFDDQNEQGSYYRTSLNILYEHDLFG